MRRTSRPLSLQRFSRMALSSALALAVTLVAVGLTASAARPATALAAGQSQASFPRLAHWWGGSTASLAEDARRDYYVPYDDDPLHPDTAAIASLRAFNPAIILLASSSAAELDYSPTNDRAFDAQRLGAIPTSWLLTQVGSTLSAPVTSTGVSIPVADTSKFRVDDLIVIDDEKCLVTGVAGALTVKRGYAGSTAAAHASATRVASVVSGWSYAATLDMTAACPLGRATGAFATPGTGTERASEWLARRTAGICAAADWDGVFIDVCTGAYAEGFVGSAACRTIANRAAPTTEADYTAFDKAWQTGIENYLSRVRALVGDEAVLTNSAPPVFSTVNGSAFEGFPAADTTPAEWHATIVGPTGETYVGCYLDWSASAKTPNLTTMMTFGATTDYRLMRFGLCTALMGDGYYAYEASTSGHSISGRWYDEFDNAGLGKGYLGSPVGAMYPVAGNRSDVYRRDFTGGVALVNATNAAVTVNLNGTFRKIKGTQAPLINDGSLVTAVTLPAKDGLVLLSTSSVAPPVTLTYIAGTAGTISGTSPQSVASGGSGTAVTAVANSGYHFAFWSDGSTANPRTDTNVTANKSVTGYFAANVTTTYTLTYTAGAGGTISGTSPQSVASGGSGSAVTAVAKSGYRFVGWSDGGLSAARTDTGVTANKSVSASFAADGTTGYTLTYIAGTAGTISGTSPQSVASGGSGTAVTAVANSGYHFAFWSDGSTANPRTDTNVTANKSVTGYFAANVTTTYTLTYTAGAGGTISGTSPQSVASGGSGSAVTAVAKSGYRFVGWSDGGLSAARTDTGVTANKSVSASFAADGTTGYTLTYIAGTAGTISGTSPQSVASGGSGTAVTAVANSGYHFAFWSDGSTANPRTDTNVTANKSVTAYFAANVTTTYTLTYTAGAGGTISGTSPQTVTSGGSGSAVTAVAKSGYRFVGWSDGGLSAARTDTGVTANKSVSASFAANGTTGYTLTYIAGTAGTISGTSPQSVASGGSGTAVTAVANSGYHFAFWSDGSTANPRTDTNVTANKSVTAYFAANVTTTYTLTYTAGAGGTISGTSPQTVTSGGSGSAVTAVAKSGYRFVSWSDGGLSAARTDTGVTANKSVSASFAANGTTGYTLTYIAGTAGTISGTSPQTVTSGGSGTAVTAVANSGYHFAFWSDGSTANPRTDTGVTASKSVTAYFALTPATTTLTIDYAQNASFHADIYMAIYDENMNLVAEDLTVRDRSLSLASVVPSGHTYYLYCSWSAYEESYDADAWHTVTAAQALPGGSVTWDVPY